MNILLIGNGFDLAHDLPTRYIDFLAFGKLVEDIFGFPDDVRDRQIYVNELEASNMSNSVKQKLIDAFDRRKFSEGKVVGLDERDKMIMDMHELLNENIWFKYFQEKKKSIGENWIDFESEISKVIQALDKNRRILVTEESLNDEEKAIISNIGRLTGKLVEVAKNNRFESEKTIKHVIGLLEGYLHELIRILEVYLSESVGKDEDVPKIDEIEILEIDKVLSFNYTKTYEQYYGNCGVKYSYIHGKVEEKGTLESNNMVLGIDEYLIGEEKDKDIIFLGFKKFFQRILKATDSNYYDWFDVIEKSKDFSNLYIFGHSLDVTDRDVLRKFICNEKIKTTIFYYCEYENDKRTLGKLIKNLVKVIGQDELIRRTGGQNKTIEFRAQKVRESNNRAGVCKTQKT